MNNKITKIVEKYNLITPHDTVLIALSGGADSVLLAKYLLSVKDKYSLTLKAAHIEHGIRGEESLLDCNFVEEFCKENGIELFVKHIDAPTEAKIAGMGVEEYSREKRYEFFDTIECNKIATAHNLSDNVETVLFRLARGTSIKGMCGIPIKRGKIIRPLLEVSGEEIRKYLDKNGIKYAVDSTNADDKYSRNHIRKNIIPLFKQLNPEFETSVKRFIESANDDELFLDNSAEKVFETAFYKNEIKLEKLKTLSKSEIKRVLIKYYSLYDISVDEYHLNESLKLVFAPGRLQLKNDYFAISNKRRLRVTSFKETLDFDDIKIEKQNISRTEFLNKCELLKKEFDFYCDYDKIVGNISVSGRNDGDKISPIGRDCTKSLKKLFNELEIPVEERQNIPIIHDEKGIIGVYGICEDERVKIDNTTINVLLIKIRTED